MIRSLASDVTLGYLAEHAVVCSNMLEQINTFVYTLALVFVVLEKQKAKKNKCFIYRPDVPSYGS